MEVVKGFFDDETDILLLEITFNIICIFSVAIKNMYFNVIIDRIPSNRKNDVKLY